MFYTSSLLFVIKLLLINLSFSQRVLKNKKDRDKTFLFQKKAIHEWTTNLTDADFDSSHWTQITKKKLPNDIFDFYTQRLSDIFSSNKAKLNFIMIGSFNGIHFKTMDHFINNLNWNGAFTESIYNSYIDFNTFLQKSLVVDRFFTVNTAISDICSGINITVKVNSHPTEVTHPTSSKWLTLLRRSPPIESINKLPAQDISVPCQTAESLMSQWTIDTYRKLPKTAQNRRMEPRVHILKINSDELNYSVLNGFLRTDAKPESLPLLISLDTKELDLDKKKLAMNLLKTKGYIFQNTSTDIFALLHSNAIAITPMGRAGKGGKKEVTASVEKIKDHSGKSENNLKKGKKRRKHKKSSD